MLNFTSKRDIKHVKIPLGHRSATNVETVITKANEKWTFSKQERS